MSRKTLGAAFVVLIAIFGAGCKSWSERGAKGVGLLQPASPNESKFSSYQPAHPYQPLAKGLLGRKLHATAPDAGTSIEVHDFLVGPNQKTASYSLPGSAIFEIQTGSGQLKIGGQSQKIATGMTLEVAAGQPFTIENESEVPIGIRVAILASK